jgi:hypothetical protein
MPGDTTQNASDQKLNIPPPGDAPQANGLVKEDPMFDPSWDLKVVKGAEANKEPATPPTKQDTQAPLPKVEPVPVKAPAPQSEKPLAKAEGEKSEVKPMPEVVPLPPVPAGTQLPQQASEKPVAPLPAPIKQKEKEVKRKSMIIWGDLLSCWVLGIGAILIMLIVLLFLVAKSGILNIPLISSWFYNAPMPQRFVEAQPISWEEFRGVATGRLVGLGLDTEPPIKLELSEQEFTGLLRGVIADGLRSTEYRADVAQVVFLPESVELYFYLTWRELLTFEILTHLSPIVEDDGTLRFQVVDARFGDLPLPGLWVMRAIGYFFARDVGAWRIVLSNGYGIQSAGLVDQKIQLFIGPVLVQ